MIESNKQQICTFVGTIKNLHRFMNVIKHLDPTGKEIKQASRKYFNDKPFETKIDFCA